MRYFPGFVMMVLTMLPTSGLIASAEPDKAVAEVLPADATAGGPAPTMDGTYMIRGSSVNIIKSVPSGSQGAQRPVQIIQQSPAPMPGGGSRTLMADGSHAIRNESGTLIEIVPGEGGENIRGAVAPVAEIQTLANDAAMARIHDPAAGRTVAVPAARPVVPKESPEPFSNLPKARVAE